MEINNIIWQYFKCVYDVTAITMTTSERYESTLSFQFLLITYYKTIIELVTYHFSFFLRS